MGVDRIGSFAEGLFGSLFIGCKGFARTGLSGLDPELCATGIKDRPAKARADDEISRSTFKQCREVGAGKSATAGE